MQRTLQHQSPAKHAGVRSACMGACVWQSSCSSPSWSSSKLCSDVKLPSCVSVSSELLARSQALAVVPLSLLLLAAWSLLPVLPLLPRQLTAADWVCFCASPFALAAPALCATLSSVGRPPACSAAVHRLSRRATSAHNSLSSCCR